MVMYSRIKVTQQIQGSRPGSSSVRMKAICSSVHSTIWPSRASCSRSSPSHSGGGSSSRRHYSGSRIHSHPTHGAITHHTSSSHSSHRIHHAHIHASHPHTAVHHHRIHHPHPHPHITHSHSHPTHAHTSTGHLHHACI